MVAWNVLLETTEDGKALATILELPSICLMADTGEDAITQARKLLEERLAKAEIVSIEVDPADSKSKHPVLERVGIFKDDLDFAQIVEQMRVEREQPDEE